MILNERTKFSEKKKCDELINELRKYSFELCVFFKERFTRIMFFDLTMF
jgi:hypothetical protein